MKRLLLAVALAVVAAPIVRADGNLIVNPNFDTDISSWANGNINSITSAWDSRDLLSDPASGSARVTSTQATAGGPDAGGSGLIQCVDIGGVGTLRRFALSAFYFIPSGQATTAEPDLSVVWFQDPGCGSFLVGSQRNSDQGASSTDAWLQLQMGAQAPLTAQSVRVFLRPRKVEAGGSIDVLFDAVFLPEPDAAPLGLVAVAALGSLRRRARSRG